MARAAFAMLALGSLSLSLLAAAAWIVSYARPMDWQAIRYSSAPGWTIEYERDGVTPDSVEAPLTRDRTGQRQPGEWRGWWMRSRRGCVTVTQQEVELGSTTGLILMSRLSLAAVSTPEMSEGGFFYIPPPKLPETGRSESIDVRVKVSDPEEASTLLARLGFGFAADAQQKTDGSTAEPLRAVVRLAMLPYWSVVLVGLPIPLAWLGRLLRSRRCAREGCCPACGYDLRATPNQCPECGSRFS